MSRGVLEKMLLDVEMSKYYISKWNSQAEIKVHETKELIFNVNRYKKYEIRNNRCAISCFQSCA